MRTHDVVTIGSATQDTYVLTSGKSTPIKSRRGIRSFVFPLGDKIELRDVHLEVGGGATNTAATFAQMGLSVGCVTQVGGDPSGEFVLRELRTMNIGTEHIATVNKGRTGYSVIFLSPSGERTIFVYRGVTEHAMSGKVLSLLNTKWAYVTSLSGNKELLGKVFALKYRGVNMAWNPGIHELKQGSRFLRSMLRKTDVLILNDTEASILFGNSLSTQSIRRMTSAVTVITYGKKGSRCFAGSKVLRCTLRPVQTIDTTGAGDAFGSGFVTGILQKPGDFAYALKLGSAIAMSVVQQIGAKHGLVPSAKLHALDRRIKVT